MNATSFVCLCKIVELKDDEEQEIEQIIDITSKNIVAARSTIEELLNKSVIESTALRYEIISIVPKSWKP